MNTSCIVPDWLHDIFLGYDDPGAAHYSRYIICAFKEVGEIDLLGLFRRGLTKRLFKTDFILAIKQCKKA